MIDYIEEKLDLLSQFSIKVTKEEQKQLIGMNSEFAVDRFMRKLFHKYL